MMSSSLLGDLSPLCPVVEKDLSDSGSIDCSIEFLMQAGGRLALLFFNRAKKLWIVKQVIARGSDDGSSGSLAKRPRNAGGEEGLLQVALGNQSVLI